MTDIILNGENYHLDESGEGQHYVRSHQPLRPPNAQLVQGENGQFQLRPDLLQWSWTDWSGGENQIKLDSQAPDRAYILQNVSPFRRKGELGLGYKITVTQDSTGASDFAEPGTLVKAYGSLFMVGSGDNDIWEWDGSKWGASEAITTAVASVGSPANSSIGDDEYLFVKSGNADVKIHRRDSGGTWTNHNDQCGLTGEVILTELGPYVYVWEPSSGKVYEISKATANTATPEVEIGNIPISSTLNADMFLMAAGDNRIYAVTTINGETFIYEIIPTSAAGTGYTVELSKVPGITAEAVFYAGGTLYFVGYDAVPTGSLGPDRQIFYVDPEGTYGTLGSLRGFARGTGASGPSSLYPVPAGGRLALSALALPGTWEDETQDEVRMSLFEIDQISGGIASVGSAGGHLSATEQATSLVYFEGKYFASLATKVVHWEPDTVEDAIVGYAVSPSNDFGIAGEKILEQIEVICAPLPTGASITLGYSEDGGLWTSTASITTGAAVGGAFQISTDSSTKTFRSLQVRVKLTPEEGPPSAAPIIKAVNVFARVNRRLRVWDLIIDLADDAHSGFNGKKQIANLAAIGENTVVAFVDRYLTHDDTDGGTSLDVIVDSISFNLDRPGEGQALIRLVEVL